MQRQVAAAEAKSTALEGQLAQQKAALEAQITQLTAKVEADVCAVEISGVAGWNSVVNGLYEPTAERRHGAPVYRKRGAANGDPEWLLKWSNGDWMVQPTANKDAGNQLLLLRGNIAATTAAAKRATTPLDVPVADWTKPDGNGEGQWAHPAGLRVRAAVGGA